MTKPTSTLASHHGRRALQPRSKPDPKIPMPRRKKNLIKQYNSNKEYANDRNSILDTEITKHFPGHGSFKGKITEYHLASDNYSINYQDGDSEIMSHSNNLKYIKGTQQYKDHNENQMALYSAFNTAVSTTIAPSDNVPENYKDARATPDVADWMKACDVEMGKLRSLGCWEVIPRSTLPPNVSVMKSGHSDTRQTNLATSNQLATVHDS